MSRQDRSFAEPSYPTEERAAKRKGLGAKANLVRRSVGRNSPPRPGPDGEFLDKN